MSKRYDDITRLLDGEMTGSDRRKFLQELDRNHPEEWRTLALGFVEQQMITEALRSQKSTQQTKVESINQSPSWNIAWLGGVAAALILGLFLGTLQFGKKIQTGRVQNTASTQQQPSPPSTTDRNIALAGGVQPLEKLNSVLKEQGYTPKMTRGYIEAEMADGRQLIVPISQLAMSDKE